MNVREFIILRPNKSLNMLTPDGDVYLTPENSKALLDGKSVLGNLDDPKKAVEIAAEELLAQWVLSAYSVKGEWRMLTSYPPENAQKEDQESGPLEQLLEMETDFFNRLTDNYEEYMRQLQLKTVHNVIELAPEITAVKMVYRDLMDTGYSTEQLEHLLRFANPLEVMRDIWMGEQCRIEEQYRSYISEKTFLVLWNLLDEARCQAAL